MAFRTSENVGNIIHGMKELIENDKAVRIKQDKGGWEYAGPEFRSLVVRLKEDLVNEGHDVRGCTIWHFFRGANIKNPTKGLIMLAINGTATLSPGGHLTSESFSYVKDEPAFFAGARGVDIAFVVLEPERTEGKDGAQGPEAAMEIDIKPAK